MTFDFMTQMTLSQLLPHADEYIKIKKLERKGPPDIFLNVEKDL